MAENLLTQGKEKGKKKKRKKSPNVGRFDQDKIAFITGRGFFFFFLLKSWRFGVGKKFAFLFPFFFLFFVFVFPHFILLNASSVYVHSTEYRSQILHTYICMYVHMYCTHICNLYTLLQVQIMYVFADRDSLIKFENLCTCIYVCLVQGTKNISLNAYLRVKRQGNSRHSNMAANPVVSSQLLPGRERGVSVARQPTG